MFEINMCFTVMGQKTEIIGKYTAKLCKCRKGKTTTLSKLSIRGINSVLNILRALKNSQRKMKLCLCYGLS